MDSTSSSFPADLHDITTSLTAIIASNIANPTTKAISISNLLSPLQDPSRLIGVISSITNILACTDESYQISSNKFFLIIVKCVDLSQINQNVFDKQQFSQDSTNIVLFLAHIKFFDFSSSNMPTTLQISSDSYWLDLRYPPFILPTFSDPQNESIFNSVSSITTSLYTNCHKLYLSSSNLSTS